MDRHVSNARSMTFLVSASLMYVSSLWVNGKKKTAVLNPKQVKIWDKHQILAIVLVPFQG